MKNISTKLLIIVAIVVVALLGVTVAGVVILNSPSIVIARTAKNTVNGFLNRGEIQPLYSTVNGGSLEFSLGEMSETDDDGEKDVFFDGKASGKLYFSKKALMLSDLDAEIDDFKISNGEVYVSRDTIYVSEDEILDGAYGLNIESLLEDLKNSIFAHNSGSDYELDEEIYEQITDVLEKLEENSKLEKDVRKLSKTILKDLAKIVVENSEITSEKTNTRIGGNKEKVRMVTITINEDAAENIIKDVYDYLCESEDIAEFIEKYEDIIISLLGDEYDEDEYDSLKDAYDELLKDAEEYIDDICDELDDFGTIEVKIATPKAKSKLLKLEISIDDEKILSVDCGTKGIKKTDSISINIADEIEIAYSIKENNKKAVTAVIKLEIDDSTCEISYKINREKETYTIEYKETYETYSGAKKTDSYVIKGDFINNRNSITMSVDTITNKYTTDFDDDSKDTESKYVITLDASLTIKTSDRMPKVKKDFNTISDITDKDIEKWLEKIEDLDLF